MSLELDRLFKHGIFLAIPFVKAFPKRILNLSLKLFLHIIKSKLPLLWRDEDTQCCQLSGYQLAYNAGTGINDIPPPLLHGSAIALYPYPPTQIHEGPEVLLDQSFAYGHIGVSKPPGPLGKR